MAKNLKNPIAQLCWAECTSSKCRKSLMYARLKDNTRKGLHSITHAVVATLSSPLPVLLVREVIDHYLKEIFIQLLQGNQVDLGPLGTLKPHACLVHPILRVEDMEEAEVQLDHVSFTPHEDFREALQLVCCELEKRNPYRIEDYARLILSYIQANPGCSFEMIHAFAKLHSCVLGRYLKRLVQQHHIRCRQEYGQRYYWIEAKA